MRIQNRDVGLNVGDDGPVSTHTLAGAVPACSTTPSANAIRSGRSSGNFVVGITE